MRILVLGSLYPDSFTRNIVCTLEAMKHEVVNVPYGRPPRWLPYSLRILFRRLFERGWMGGSARAFLRQAREFQPDVILNAYGDLSPEAVEGLRRESRAALAAWFPDALRNLGREYLLASPYDAWFFKDRYLVDFLCQKLGRPAFYLPECCNPLWHRRVELTEADRRRYGCDLTTACNMYYSRALLLEPFANYDFKIWGRNYPPWLNSSLQQAYQNYYVAEVEKAKAFNAAKIVLNTMHYAEIHSVNVRLFEIAGCGAFQVAEYREALRELFEPEVEVVTFRTREELKEKVDYYLARPEERQRIADRAYARAHREHTYEHRLRRLLSIVSELRAGRTPPAYA